LDLGFLRVLAREGCGAEAYGRYELYISRLVGFDRKKIVFNGVNRSREDLKVAIEADVQMHVDVPEELELLNEISRDQGKVTKVSLRIVPTLHTLDDKEMLDYRFSPPNVSLGSWIREMQFGMDLETAHSAFERSLHLKNVKVDGLMMHCANARRSGYLTQEINEALGFAEALKNEFGFELDVFDLGGAFIPTSSIMSGLNLEWPRTFSTKHINEVAKEMTDAIKVNCEERGLGQPLLIMEPGRGLAQSTELLLSRVGRLKRLYGRTYAFLDADINLVHPMLHERHEIFVANTPNSVTSEKIDFRGSTCTAAEALFAGGQTRECPRLQGGDLVAIMDVGAYCESNFEDLNAVPKPATVMVREGNVAIIRNRESIQDVIAHERIPDWLL
jgi:diaminopimelate decarboxylase